MASCCLNSGLRHCPSVAAHQMMSLLVRQQRGASGAALLQRQRQQQQQQQQPDAPQKPHSRGAGLTATAATTGACGSGGYGVPSGEDASLMSAALTASLAHARRALELDLENGYSWYVLAMAQMADYFQGEHHPPGRGGGGGEGGGGTGPGMGPSVHISGSGDGCRARGRGGRGDLHRVMAAFAQAERCGCSNLPDLYYNRAALHAFVQDFEAALHDYSRAASLDPGLPAPAQMESLLVLLGQLSGLVAARGGVRDRNWAAVTALLAGDSVRVSELLPFIHHERLAVRTIRDLQPGPNRGLAVLCRALVFVSPTLNASGTLYLVCVDAGGCCFVLALTHIYHDAFDMTQLLTIVHPEMRQVDVTWPPPACNTAATPASSPALSPPSPHRSHAAAAIATAATTADPATANASPDSESRSSSWDSAIQGAVASMGAGAATGMESRVGPGPALRQAPLPSTSMAVPSRTYRFPLLMVGCDPGCRSAVLVDGVPVHQAPQTPLLRHVMRAA
ncbi:hypothetical protein Vretimale_5012 [Volvox reticuliferus]|nr:hypothetical protein Vretimale_5012 [Volvox reticuliferus]